MVQPPPVPAHVQPEVLQRIGTIQTGGVCPTAKIGLRQMFCICFGQSGFAGYVSLVGRGGWFLRRQHGYPSRIIWIVRASY